MHSRPLTGEQLAVTAALSAGDAGRLYRIVSKLFDEGIGLESVLFDVLLPAEGEVGGRWQGGDYLVPEEHLASTTIETVISLLAGSLDQPMDGTHVVLASAEGDNHSIAGRATSAYLLFLGYRTTFLGADVPAAELQEFLELEGPDVLVLSCTMPGQLVGARAGVKAAHSAGVPVIVGGRAFGGSSRRALEIGADAWAETPRDLPRLLESWAPEIATAEEAGKEPSEELKALLDNRTSILANAQSHLTDIGVESAERLRVELDVLLGAVEGAMLLEDGTVVEETVAWQAETLGSHGIQSFDALRQALRSAVASWPTAGSLLDDHATDGHRG